MRRVANKEAVTACVNYIKDSSEYTFEKFLKSHNHWRNEDLSGRNIRISCPFHSDSNPSFGIDEERGISNCLSCGRGGTYLNFVVTFNKIILKSNEGFYETLNNILLSDPKMQLIVGYASIFKEERKSLDEIVKIKKKKFVKEQILIHLSYTEVAKKMIREGLNDYELIKLAILYIQEGYKPEEVYRLLKDEDITTSDSREVFDNISLEDILAGVDLDINLDQEE